MPCSVWWRANTDRVRDFASRRAAGTRPAGAPAWRRGARGARGAGRGDGAGDDAERGRLVERQPDAGLVDAAQVEVLVARRGEHGVGIDAVDGDRVEPAVVAEREAGGAQGV